MRRIVSVVVVSLACSGASWAAEGPAPVAFALPPSAVSSAQSLSFRDSAVRLPGASGTAISAMPQASTSRPGPAAQLGRLLAVNLAQHYGLGGKLANLDRPGATCMLNPGAAPCRDEAGLAEDPAVATNLH